MNILSVYEKYRIMPSLQLHMLRVAGVAKTLCDHLEENVDVYSVTAACLLHDIGNILKFDLDRFPAFLQPQGLEYWQSVKDDFLKHYGPDEHESSIKIAAELGATPKIISLVDAVGFLQIGTVYKKRNLEKMICEYADVRVAPWGVVSLDERCDDLEKRYASRHSSIADQKAQKVFRDFAHKIEKYLFSHATILPTDITDRTVDGKIEGLKAFSLS